MSRFWAPGGVRREVLLTAVGDPTADLTSAVLALHQSGAAACQAAGALSIPDEAALAGVLSKAHDGEQDIREAVSKSTSPSYGPLLVRDLVEAADASAVSLFTRLRANGVPATMACERVGMVYGVPAREIGAFAKAAGDVRAHPAVLVDLADRALLGFVARVVDEEGVVVSKALATVELAEFDLLHPRGPDGRFTEAKTSQPVRKPFRATSTRAKLAEIKLPQRQSRVSRTAEPEVQRVTQARAVQARAVFMPELSTKAAVEAEARTEVESKLRETKLKPSVFDIDYNYTPQAGFTEIKTPLGMVAHEGQYDNAKYNVEEFFSNARDETLSVTGRKDVILFRLGALQNALGSSVSDLGVTPDDLDVPSQALFTSMQGAVERQSDRGVHVEYADTVAEIEDAKYDAIRRAHPDWDVGMINVAASRATDRIALYSSPVGPKSQIKIVYTDHEKSAVPVIEIVGAMGYQEPGGKDQRHQSYQLDPNQVFEVDVQPGGSLTWLRAFNNAIDQHVYRLRIRPADMGSEVDKALAPAELMEFNRVHTRDEAGRFTSTGAGPSTVVRAPFRATSTRAKLAEIKAPTRQSRMTRTQEVAAEPQTRVVEDRKTEARKIMRTELKAQLRESRADAPAAKPNRPLAFDQERTHMVFTQEAYETLRNTMTSQKKLSKESRKYMNEWGRPGYGWDLHAKIESAVIEGATGEDLIESSYTEERVFGDSKYFKGTKDEVELQKKAYMSKIMDNNAEVEWVHAREYTVDEADTSGWDEDMAILDPDEHDHPMDAPQGASFFRFFVNAKPEGVIHVVELENDAITSSTDELVLRPKWDHPVRYRENMVDVDQTEIAAINPHIQMWVLERASNWE